MLFFLGAPICPCSLAGLPAGFFNQDLHQIYKTLHHPVYVHAWWYCTQFALVYCRILSMNCINRLARDPMCPGLARTRAPCRCSHCSGLMSRGSASSSICTRNHLCMRLLRALRTKHIEWELWVPYVNRYVYMYVHIYFPPHYYGSSKVNDNSEKSA